MTAAYIQTVLALLFVLVLIFAGAYFMKKKQVRGGFMSIVGYQPIGPKKGVAALKVGREVLILGISANDMRLLKTMPEEETGLHDAQEGNEKFSKFKLRIREESK